MFNIYLLVDCSLTAEYRACTYSYPVLPSLPSLSIWFTDLLTLFIVLFVDQSTQQLGSIGRAEEAAITTVYASWQKVSGNVRRGRNEDLAAMQDLVSLSSATLSILQFINLCCAVL